MKKLLLILALFLVPSAAFAQCTGVFGANQVCGSTAGGPPHAVPFTSFAPIPLTLAQYHFYIGNASNVAVDTTLTGDCVYGALGIVCTKTNGVAFGGFATQTPPLGIASNCLQADAAGVVTGTGAPCGSGSGAVNSVANSDGTLTISPTTGTVVASLALGHANVWTARQTFKSGPWCDPIAYGAAGDGVTDDTAAFQSCINALLAKTQGMMVVTQTATGAAYCIKGGLTVTSGNSNPGGVRIVGFGLPVLSSCGGNTAPIITLSTPYSTIENIEFLGYGFGTDTFGAATQPVINLLSPCNGCVVDHSYIFGGTRGIQTDACLAYITRTTIQYQYGSAMLYNFNCGSIAMHNVFDQVAPIAIPYGSTFNARSNSTAYTAGTVVSTGGYYIQYQTNGTSGGAPPTMKNYGATITDGTATALLIGPNPYYSVQVDTGSQEMQLIGNDMTCVCTAGTAVTNSFAGTAPILTHLTDNTPGGNITAGILVSAGSDLHVTGNEVNGCLITGCAGIYLNSSGGQNIINGLRILNNVGYGVLIGAGANHIISNAMFSGTHTSGIAVAANITNFAFTGNLMTGGNLGTGISIAAGTSDYYTVTGNMCNGTTFVNGGTGTHTLVQASCP